MALDITAYQIARPLTPEERAAIPIGDDPDPQDWWYENKADNSDLRKPYTEFPATADGLTALDYVVCEGLTVAFRAGSYSGYNAWRSDLAKMVGLDDTKEFWSNPPKSHPFIELIINSDCESIIGPNSCAKLAQDFDQHATKAATFAQTLGADFGGWWLARYQSWRDAFTLAAHTGCVVLH